MSSRKDRKRRHQMNFEETEKINGYQRHNKKHYIYHIVRKTDKALGKYRGIKGGRILQLKLYENDELVALYNRGWQKKTLNKNAHAVLRKLIKNFNK